MMSIRTKLLVVFLGLAITPTILAGFHTYRVARRALEQRIGQDIQQQAARVMGEIDRMVFERYRDVQIWVHDPIMENLLDRDAHQRVTDFLRLRQSLSRGYLAIFCLTPQGEVVAATDASLIGRSFADTSWVQQAVASDQVIILGPEKLALTGDYTLSFVANIQSGSSSLATRETAQEAAGAGAAASRTDPAPQTTGILVALVSWSEILNLVNTVSILGELGQSKAAYALLVDARGVVLTQPYFEQRDLILQQNLQTAGLRSATLAAAGRVGYVVEPGLYGALKLIGFAPSQGYREYRGLGWSMLIFQRLDEAFQPIKVLQTQSLITGILLMLPMLLAVYSLSRGIIRPITQLTSATRAIAKGALAHRVTMRSRDELGVLAEAFNKMAEDLDRAAEAERRRAQEQAQLNAELTKEIAGRQQAEGKLRDYASQLERSNKELDDFTYIVSHDLKEPLRSLDAFSKFVAEDYGDRLDDEGRGYLQRIRTNAKRMQQLIEDLLAVSRLSQRPNELQTVKVQELIDEVQQRLEYAIQEKHVQLLVEGELPVLVCDRIRLTEVFANLVSNAIKYNDKPACRIEIDCRTTESEYEFAVKDNGPGIEPQYHQKIFEIFQRLGRKEEQEGTGVGLAIVKKVVELHHGRIWVDSTVGVGTTFYFTIPKEEDVIRGKKKLGEILIGKQLITQADLDQALAEQQRLERGGQAS